jgi:hypothetical protein
MVPNAGTYLLAPGLLAVTGFVQPITPRNLVVVDDRCKVRRLPRLA